MSEYKGIWVIAERKSDNSIAGVTLELINAAKELSGQLGGEEVGTILISGNENVDDLIRTISEAGSDKIYHIQNENLSQYSTEMYTDAVSQAIEQKKPSIVLVGATTTGRDFASRVAARIYTGLTADCTALSINEEGLLAAKDRHSAATYGYHFMQNS